MYAVSAPFELLFPQTFSKLKPAYDQAPIPVIRKLSMRNCFISLIGQKKSDRALKNISYITITKLFTNQSEASALPAG